MLRLWWLGIGITTLTLAAGCQAPQSREPEPSAPPATRDLNAQFRDVQDISRWEARFESESREVFRHRVQIVDAMHLHPGMDVADIGAGTGLFEPLLAVAVSPGGTVYAVDISEKFLEHIAERCRALGLPNVETVLSTQDDVKLAPFSVDVVFICDTYHHFENVRPMNEGIYKALRPGGRLFVVDFVREEGVSRQWTLDHVRAGREVFAREIEAVGFERLPDPPHAFLSENYMMAFVKPMPAPSAPGGQPMHDGDMPDEDGM